MSNRFDQNHAAAKKWLDSLIIGKNPSRVVGELVDHVSLHFIAEDSFMREINYPQAKREKHLKEHNYLQESLLAILSRLVSGNITQEELDVFREHLVLHIDSLDAEMMEYTKVYYPERLYETEFTD